MCITLKPFCIQNIGTIFVAFILPDTHNNFTVRKMTGSLINRPYVNSLSIKLILWNMIFTRYGGIYFRLSEYDLDMVEYDLDTAEYNLDTAEYNLDTTRYNFDTADYSLDTAEYDLDTAEYNLNTTEFNLNTAQFSLN